MNERELSEFLRLLAADKFERNDQLKLLKNIDDVQKSYKKIIKEKCLNKSF